MINPKIVCEHFLGRKMPSRRQVHSRVHLGQLVGLDNTVFRSQEGETLQFRWTRYTDGVGITILKSERDVGHESEQRPTPVEEDTVYYGALTSQRREAITGPLVTVDPGRRDLSFCAGAGSIPQTPLKFRYTKAQQDKSRKAKKYMISKKKMHKYQPDAGQQQYRYWNRDLAACLNMHTITDQYPGPGRDSGENEDKEKGEGEGSDEDDKDNHMDENDMVPHT
ncbi:hypothetical protein BX666DRAFT_2122303 [Dichotomocladium elegans]|nr:hypothetical protein BX666DRAFT_2122303 [Dichotomocladium elegans]